MANRSTNSLLDPCTAIRGFQNSKLELALETGVRAFRALERLRIGRRHEAVPGSAVLRM